VLHRDDDLAWLSLRNAASVHAIAVDQLNAYDVLVNDEVVFTSAALDAFVAGPASGRSAKAVASESELEGAGFAVADLADAELVAPELLPQSEDTSSEPTNADLATTAVDVDEPEAEGDVK
jgi:large subunit ribosomal protein L4